MKSVHIGMTALSVLLSAACGSNTTGDSLTQYQDEMASDVTSVQTALTVHHQQVLAGDDLHQIGTLEQQHLQLMTTDMGHMQDINDSIVACGNNMNMNMGGVVAGHMGGPMHMAGPNGTGYAMMQSACQGMASVMGEASAELERHVHAMQAAPDIAAARAEEHHYMSTMDPLVQHMQTRDQDIWQGMQHMQSAGYSMMCPAGSRVQHHGPN